MLQPLPARSLASRPPAAVAALAVIKRWSIKAIARTLIIAYALFLLKPVMPILLDGLAHTFYRSIHIAVVHRVHGKEHVHYELRKAAESEKDGVGQKQKTVVEDDVYTLPILLTPTKSTAYSVASIKPMSRHLNAHYSADISRNYPPPKQAPSCAC